MMLRSAGPCRRARSGRRRVHPRRAGDRARASSLIVGVITAALITSLNVSSSTTAQVNDSNEAGLASAFLFRDAQSAGGILPTTAYSDTSRGVSTTDWAGCTQGTAALVVRFSWIEQGSTPASSNVATYAFAGSTLTRQICKDGIAGASVVLGSHFASAAASCLPVPAVTTPPTPNCAGRPTSVSLTVYRFGRTCSTLCCVDSIVARPAHLNWRSSVRAPH